MFVKGTKTSEIVTRAMTDLVSKAPFEIVIALVVCYLLVHVKETTGLLIQEVRQIIRVL